MITNSLSPSPFQRLLNLWKYYYFRQPASFAHSAIAGLSVACQIGFCFLYFELRRSLIPLKLSITEVVFTCYNHFSWACTSFWAFGQTR